ncbi:MAG: hypothetical protein IKW00_04585 [Clostridia bacterium]|nr:hypothetical protein [Clostridia bacterium]
MKKLLAIVLLLCLVCTSAFAAGKLERTETRVVREKREYDDNYEIKVFIQMKNTGDAPVGLDSAKIKLLDASGNVLEETTAYGMYPSTLQPGEVGYIYEYFYSIEADKATALSSYTVEFEAEDSWLDELKPVEHTAKYEAVERWGEKYPTVFYTVTNNTAETLWDVELISVIRAADGKILAMLNDTMYNVGVEPGSTVQYKSEMSSGDLERWTAKGYTVGAVESFAYIEIDD